MILVRLEERLGVKPNPDSSVEHPSVTFFTTVAIVSLLQAGAPHRLVSQLLIGGITELFAPAATMLMSDPGLRHFEASGLAAMPVRAAVQLVESLRES